MPAFASKGHLIRSFNKLGDLLLTFGKQNKKPKLEKSKSINNLSESQTVKPENKPKKDTPASKTSHLPALPQSMDEVKARMAAAKRNIKQARANGQPLPTSPFSEADKLAIENAGLQKKYLVHINKSNYAGNKKKIGPLENGQANYWTTTYTQLEYADSDAKLISQAVGTTYDPAAKYKLLIIDKDAAAASGQMTSFIPTYDNLGKLAKSEMTSTNPAHIDAVMTEPYSKTYAGHVAEAKAKKIDLNDSKKLNDFATQKGLSAEETDLLETRHKIKIGRAHV